MIIRRLVLALPVVFLGWIGVMALVMRLSDAAPAAVVPLPGAAVLAHLPEGTGILELSPYAVTLANRPGLARDLYAAGAWLVLPAGLTGCLPLSKAKRTALDAGA